jgi:hypothetical protein
MPNEVKVTAYVVASVTLVAAFLSALRPYLLQTPPNIFALAALGVVVGLFLFSVIAGPFIIVYLQPCYRDTAQRILRLIFWGFIAAAVISVILPAVPSITRTSFFCFAAACLLLMKVLTSYAPARHLYAS